MSGKRDQDQGDQDQGDHDQGEPASDSDSSNESSVAGSPTDEGESAGDESAGNESTNNQSVQDKPADTQPDPDDDPVGWLPAIMAASVLMAILGLIFCAFSTWVLFQRRTELATRTIRDAYLPEIEQSYLDPETKKAVAGEISQLATDLENGKYENWQSAGILQRLQRVPVLQWGRLTAVTEFYRQQPGVDQDTIQEMDRGLNRLKRGIEMDRLTSFDLQDILEPVLVADPKSPSAFSLIQPLTIKASEKVLERTRLWLENSTIPDEEFDDVLIVDVVKEAIQIGADKGTM